MRAVPIVVLVWVFAANVFTREGKDEQDYYYIKMGVAMVVMV